MWSAISGRMYDQRAFTRIIDVNSDDIASPAAAALRETVMNLKTATTGLSPFFTLTIPVFTGEPKVDVKVMTKDGQDSNSDKISPGLELVRTRIIIEREIVRIANAIASATSVPVILGSVRD
jgi:hypothetical protein